MHRTPPESSSGPPTEGTIDSPPENTPAGSPENSPEESLGGSPKELSKRSPRESQEGSPAEAPERSSANPPEFQPAIPDCPPTNPERGLTRAEAESRRLRFGPNRLPEAPQPGLLALFLRQFKSPFIYILAFAALASFGLNQLANAGFILLVLMLNAVIGTVQEFSAQKAASALREVVRGQTRVLREGQPMKVEIEAVVPGDVVLLASGDKVPADITLVAAANLAVDESMLTGESMAVSKQPGAAVAPDAPLAERYNACFAGTIVTRGRARGVVTATAEHTELGRISRHVTYGETADPPLLRRIRRFTYQVAAAIAVAILGLVALMLLKGGYDFAGIAMMVIGLAVSTIPEGLPAALTVALAIGMRRMAARNVIIRKLVAVEALGSCTFICSDKTGTLTVNELTIRQATLADGQSFRFTGEGVAPGALLGQPIPALEVLCEAGLLANESHLDYSGGEWVSDGDIVDVAFLVMAKKLGLSVSGLRARREQLDAIPYESERAFSGSLNKHSDERTFLHVKGSPEKVLEMCTAMWVDETRQPLEKARINAEFEAMAADGYRVIALARREVSVDAAHDALGDLTYLGMVGMIDPIRADAAEAVRRCRLGGVEVAMVTGDHPATACAIARELGLDGADQKAVTGADLRALDNDLAAQDALIRSSRVFARIEPTQKERIVDSLMRAGHFVAVTGDGVNDAPAMRHAHAGVAMGKRGTDVARETADLIITDDNFASIVDGIEQGRIVYNNIRKVIALLMATAFSALVLFFLSVLAGLPMPLLAVQLLWLNLVANGVQDVGLAFEPGEGGELERPPRNPSEPVFERHILEHVLVIGTVMGVMAFAVFYVACAAGTPVDHARSLTLLLMVMFGNIHTLSARSETHSLLRMPIARNLFIAVAVPAAQGLHILAMYTPGLSDVLALSPVTFLEWCELLGLALVLLAVEELHKFTLRWRACRRDVRPNP